MSFIGCNSSSFASKLCCSRYGLVRYSWTLFWILLRSRYDFHHDGPWDMDGPWVHGPWRTTCLFYFITSNLVKPVIDEIQTLHESSLSWNHKTVYQKHEGVSSIPPRSGNPPRHSSSTSPVDNDDMNMSVDSLWGIVLVPNENLNVPPSPSLFYLGPNIHIWLWYLGPICQHEICTWSFPFLSINMSVFLYILKYSTSSVTGWINIPIRFHSIFWMTHTPVNPQTIVLFCY